MSIAFHFKFNYYLAARVKQGQQQLAGVYTPHCSREQYTIFSHARRKVICV